VAKVIKKTFLILLITSMPTHAETNTIEALESIEKPFANIGIGIENEYSSYLIQQNNYQVETKSYIYHGYQINFQHQNWKIKEESVCSNYPNNTQEKSKCQVSAKQLFNKVCTALKNKKTKASIQHRTQSMHCNATTSFQPKIIQNLISQRAYRN